jgi:hypothetical protein
VGLVQLQIVVLPTLDLEEMEPIQFLGQSWQLVVEEVGEVILDTGCLVVQEVGALDDLYHMVVEEYRDREILEAHVEVHHLTEVLVVEVQDPLDNMGQTEMGMVEMELNFMQFNIQGVVVVVVQEMEM